MISVWSRELHKFAQFAADLVGTVVATAHVRADLATDVHELPQRVRELNARLRLEGIPLLVVQGAELAADMVYALGADGVATHFAAAA